MNIHRQMTSGILNSLFEGYERPDLPIVVRHPFFDIRLMSFLAKLPNRLKTDKWLLRKAMAGKLTSAAQKSIADAVDQAYLIAIQRKPTASERTDIVSFVEQQIASYKASKRSDAQQLALTDLCQVVMSLNEFIYID